MNKITEVTLAPINAKNCSYQAEAAGCFRSRMDPNVASNKLFSNTKIQCCPRQLVTVMLHNVIQHTYLPLIATISN